jgi:hypothetical protein
MAATQSRGRTGWRAVHDVGDRRSVVVRAKAIGGRAMQEKEMTRTETVTLVEYMRRCANEDRDLDNKQNKKFLEIDDRKAEQEATIRHLRVEICNASAVAMGHVEAIKTIREEIELLNKRPKR